MALNLPTLYEHYTAGGVAAGLSASQPHFTLNNRNITLYSGAMHYFRVPRPYWRDRLRKMRAAGLNTVETYVPWNLHEPQNGTFDFGNGGSDMEAFLDVESFIKMAREEDVFVLVRPGPYICGEWEFGGLPSWLLRDKNMQIRTSKGGFVEHVTRYFGRLLPILAALQFVRGGPIIGFQVENEYGSTKSSNFVPDKQYLRELYQLFLRHQIKELLFTSDSVWKRDIGSLPELLKTANFARKPQSELNQLTNFQRHRPVMVMEYWTGWFDHWSDKHSTRNNSEFKEVLEQILQYPSSVNMYMFHGGTNWGFLNGANIESRYQPDTTSYDYDAPLAENGDYTEKYFIVKELIGRYSTVKIRLPTPPEIQPRIAYPSVRIQHQLQITNLLDMVACFKTTEVIPMELLPFNNNSGQSYGYIAYRKTLDIPTGATLTFQGQIHDSVLVVVDGTLVSPPLRAREDLNNFGYWRITNSTITLPKRKNATLDVIVANWGRNNFGKLPTFQQFKGLTHPVLLNDLELHNWEIRPLEFKTKWTNSLTKWRPVTPTNLTLNKATINLENPTDTYIDMSQWNTGIVIVNGFVLGRYMHLGPQQALYLPAPLLRKGRNDIIVFEHFIPATEISFSKDQIYFKK